MRFQLSIRSKIISVVAFLLLAMLAIGAFSIVQLRSINDAAQNIQTKQLPSIRSFGELRTHSAVYRGILRDHLLTSDTKLKTDIEKNLSDRAGRYDVAAAASERLISAPRERDLFTQLDQIWRAYRASVRDVIALSQNGESEQARRANSNDATPLGRKMDALLAELVSMSDADAAQASQSANETYARSITLLLALLGSAMLLGICAAFLLVRDIVHGIDSVLAPMQQLANGTLSTIIPHRGEKTEIGQIADKLQVFKEALVAKEASDQAATADAMWKAQRGQMIHELTQDFESMIGELVESLSSASKELEVSANALTHNFQITRTLSGNAASASITVSENVQSVAAATEQITSSAGEISRQVQAASEIAQDAVRQTQMADLNIVELSQAAVKIGDVIKLISAVAQQTDLLALNATIEAARAGEAGRGFAIVASEVKALASQTATATETIISQIAGMQVATRSSIDSIKEVGKTIGTISEVSASIAAAVEEQSAATAEIARNIQESANLSIRAATDANEVSDGTSQAGSASGQILTAAKSLSSESSRLRVEVENFLAKVRTA